MPFFNFEYSKENLSYFIPGCTGSVVLSSAYHKYAITVDAEKMRKKKRKVKPIKGRDPENRKWLRFEIVTFSGSCDWTVHEKKMGGRNEKMAGAKTIRLDWSVRKVKLI